jgi:hypothetical protein
LRDTSTASDAQPMTQLRAARGIDATKSIKNGGDLLLKLLT